MTTPAEQFTIYETPSYLADSDLDPFAPDSRDEDDGRFVEITERRAQLENADILRRARAL